MNINLYLCPKLDQKKLKHESICSIDYDCCALYIVQFYEQCGEYCYKPE